MLLILAELNHHSAGEQPVKVGRQSSEVRQTPMPENTCLPVFKGKKV
jgi:hypothetical protein